MRINANGIDIDYDVSGTDDGPVVVLSHSLGSSRVMWDPQMPALEAAYRVVSYDTRGHGGSSAPAEAYSLDQLGDDAMALLDALEIESAHWVGLSMGGMIGQNLALRQNGRLDSLVLCDTSAQIPAEARSTWDDRLAAADSGGMAPLAEPTLERWFTPDYLGGDPPAVAPIRQQFLDTPPAGFIGCCHALKPLDYLDRLGEIRLPTLIIVGEDDPGTPVAASEAMHERIAGSELAILPSAAHLSNIEQADAFNQALLGFLDGR